MINGAFRLETSFKNEPKQVHLFRMSQAKCAFSAIGKATWQWPRFLSKTPALRISCHKSSLLTLFGSSKGPPPPLAGHRQGGDPCWSQFVSFQIHNVWNLWRLKFMTLEIFDVWNLWRLKFEIHEIWNSKFREICNSCFCLEILNLKFPESWNVEFVKSEIRIL